MQGKLWLVWTVVWTESGSEGEWDSPPGEVGMVKEGTEGMILGRLEGFSGLFVSVAGATIPVFVVACRRCLSIESTQ